MYRLAGSDTTTISISYFFWELSRRADIVAKLQAEIDQAMPDPRSIPDIAVLRELPYLNAFIKEGMCSPCPPSPPRAKLTTRTGLRVHGAVPSLLERVVPASPSKNGASNASFDLMGYALPPGTVIATQAWSMHRDAAVFPSPGTFLPERWLAADAHMQQHFMPFGTGTRVCGGQPLAMLVLRTTVAAVVRNFEIVAPPETTERSMAPRDSFVRFCFSLALCFVLGWG